MDSRRDTVKLVYRIMQNPGKAVMVARAKDVEENVMRNSHVSNTYIIIKHIIFRECTDFFILEFDII